MTKRQRVQYRMFGRVSAFGATYAEKFPEGSAGHKAMAAVNAAVVQCNAAEEAKWSMRDEGVSSMWTARQLLLTRMAAVARTARAMAEETPGADSKFQLPVRRADVEVLASARAFIKDLEPVKTAFVEHGLPDTFVTDLQQAVEAFAQASSGRSVGKSGKGDAQAALRSAIRRGMKAVRLLDVIVPNAFGEKTAEVEKWQRERRVEAVGTVTATEPEETPPAQTVAPAADGEVKAA